MGKPPKQRSAGVLCISTCATEFFKDMDFTVMKEMIFSMTHNVYCQNTIYIPLCVLECREVKQSEMEQVGHFL